MRADVGGLASTVNGKFVPAAHATAGFSLASLLKEPRPYDVGAGYVLFYPGNVGTVHGGYVDAAWLRRFGTVGQVSIGPRFELLLQDRVDGIHAGVGAAMRVAVEAITFTDKDFASTTGMTAFQVTVGKAHGNLAIGLSTEVGVRRLPGALFSVYGMLAVTFRLPASVGFILYIPFPK